MGWGDIFAGITAAGAGVAQGYQWHKEQEQKAKIAEQTNELKAMVAQMQTESKERIAEGAGKVKLEVEERRARGKTAVQELVNLGKLNQIKDQGEWDMKLGELHNQGLISVAEKEALSRERVADINKTIQEAHDRARVESARIGGAAQVQSAGIHADASRDVAQTHEGGKNYRFNTAFPLDVYKAQTKAQRPLNPSPFAAPGTQPTQPFAPSYTDFMGGGGGGSMVPAPKSGAPPLSAPQPSFSFGKPAGPSPVGPQPAPPVDYAPAPPPLSATPTGPPAPAAPPAAAGFGPSAMLSSAIAGAPPTAPAAPPRDLPAPLAATAGPEPPLDSQPSFWTGLRPVPGQKSGLADDRLDEQADDIMRRMTLARKTGDRKAWSALRQQLTDMMQNQ